MQKYSDFFKTLHDEQMPAGNLGRGTHYSVLRAVTFHDNTGRSIVGGQYTDFAIIWDEDHDTRVIEPIEEIYRNGFLSSFAMFGERKGFFSAILSCSRSRIAPLPGSVESHIARLEKEVGAICNGLNDAWPSKIIDRRRLAQLENGNPIIDDASHKVNLYLDNLEMLWHLGNSRIPSRTAVAVPPAINPLLLKKLDDLEFSIRTSNTLKNGNIVLLGDLVSKTEEELLKLPNFGRLSLNEVKEKLSSFDLRLGMVTPN
jgi:hypothetical protein